jgi:hypothetical protein
LQSSPTIDCDYGSPQGYSRIECTEKNTSWVYIDILSKLHLDLYKSLFAKDKREECHRAVPEALKCPIVSPSEITQSHKAYELVTWDADDWATVELFVE